MALYDPVNGVYRKVSKKYDPVDGVYRNVTKAYDPVDGVYRQYFSGGTPVGTLAVGESVWLNVNGVQTEFLVVQQGNPDTSIYAASCDGTWLLAKDIYILKRWYLSNTSKQPYSGSTAHSYLNNTFFPLLSESVQGKIKQVQIPYNYNASKVSVRTGTNGLSTKIFLLSGSEVGLSPSDTSYYPEEGVTLDYFAGAENSKRIAYYSGSKKNWWTRTPQAQNATPYYAWHVGITGAYIDTAYITAEYGIRPAFILDSNTPFAQADGKNIIE